MSKTRIVFLFILFFSVSNSFSMSIDVSGLEVVIEKLCYDYDNANQFAHDFLNKHKSGKISIERKQAENLIIEFGNILLKIKNGEFGNILDDLVQVEFDFTDNFSARYNRLYEFYVQKSLWDRICRIRNCIRYIIQQVVNEENEKKDKLNWIEQWRLDERKSGRSSLG